ncbi:MAG TPA: Dabb family protein [Symbiobacteriaceae bacterium]
MVEHIVIFKMKPGTTPEQEQQLIEKLKALKDRIPSIVDLSAGRTFTPERGQGFTVGLVVRFRDRAGLEEYQPHPEHVKVKEYIAQICESVLAIDYEF